MNANPPTTTNPADLENVLLRLARGVASVDRAANVRKTAGKRTDSPYVASVAAS